MEIYARPIKDTIRPTETPRFNQLGLPLYLANPAEAYYSLFFDKRFREWSGRVITSAGRDREGMAEAFMNAGPFQLLARTHLQGRSGYRDGGNYYPGADFETLGEAMIRGYLTNSHLETPLAAQSIQQIETGGPIVVLPQDFVGGFNTLLAFLDPKNWQAELKFLDTAIAGILMVLAAQAGLYDPKRGLNLMPQTGIEVIATPMAMDTHKQMIALLEDVSRREIENPYRVSMTSVGEELLAIAQQTQPDLFTAKVGLFGTK